MAKGTLSRAKHSTARPTPSRRKHYSKSGHQTRLQSRSRTNPHGPALVWKPVNRNGVKLVSKDEYSEDEYNILSDSDPRLEEVLSSIEKGNALEPIDPFGNVPKASKLPESAKDPNRVYRVYADGVYDVFHYGHARSLKQAKEILPNRKVVLLVGVCTDEETRKYKGPTVMNLTERAESVRHCRWADEVIEGAPWFITQEFIDKHRIDYVTHGQDPCYDEHGNDVYEFVKSQGKMLTTQRTIGISTSDLITRIVSKSDTYLLRNLIRGMSREDLNISALKEFRVRVKGKVKDYQGQIENKVRGVMDNIDKNVKKRKLDRILPLLREKADGMLKRPKLLYQREVVDRIDSMRSKN